MQSKNILQIYSREIRDQWRDRRTIFSVVLLPLLMYPILGMATMQLTQFMRERETTLLVVGHDLLEPATSIFLRDGFAASFAESSDAKLTRLKFNGLSSDAVSVAAEQLSVDGNVLTPSTQRWRELIQQEMRHQQVDALLFISEKPVPTTPEVDASRAPQIQLFLSSSSDQSRAAGARIENILRQWHQARLRQSLAEQQVSESVLTPFHYESSDLSPPEIVNAHVWAKILPFIMFIWTLTGSFYCAVDLCAGEKERGTLETLLCSPAKRREIVIGKLLTTMTFSSISAILNITCTVITGVLLARQFASQGANALLSSMGTPPAEALFWLFLGLIPITALFGAISIAIAAFARSSKEGQYYLMPVLMVCLPLILIPVVQGIEFDLGLSLIPVTGLMFLMRILIEGDYATAARFVCPVILVNGFCVHLAISWAVHQFNDESVLFRPSEKFSLTRWLSNKIQQREGLPTIGQVVLCTALILGLRFFLQIASVPPSDWNGFAFQTLSMLVIAVGLPAILLAYFFTKSPYRTLRLRVNSISAIGGAFLLAIFFHPMITGFQQIVVALYPLSQDMGGLHKVMMDLFADAPNMWCIFLILAVLPAVCEELAFRGFILSGLQRLHRPGIAIVVSAVLFGITHGLLQQSIVASFVGVILGLLALKTGSLIPCIVYHATHNIITLQIPLMSSHSIEQSRLLSFIFSIKKNSAGQVTEIGYEFLPATVMFIFGLWILLGMETWQDEEDEAPLGVMFPEASALPSVPAAATWVSPR